MTRLNQFILAADYLTRPPASLASYGRARACSSTIDHVNYCEKVTRFLFCSFFLGLCVDQIPRLRAVSHLNYFVARKNTQLAGLFLMRHLVVTDVLDVS